MTTLLRSQIITGCCDTVISSVHRHDFHRCPCGGTYIDGGRDYVRLGGHIHDFTPAHIEVEEDLTNPEAGAVLAVYKAVYTAWEVSKQRRQRGVSISAVRRFMSRGGWFNGSSLTLDDCIKLLETNHLIFKWENAQGAVRMEPRVPLEKRDDV